ncbi:DUF4169 family protein [Mesorhizobium sp. YIM 152430]|uniref:DUF4169 family protein n=1 Tax=Mesorhizobium sp. YIM 152430 TaxID=3031761 RepID=UPI0023DB737A|nr:DUF4169 family protein [Mesorhizobium sp. YIM 152430]MDF1598334.1 DUF4169 family protein [Mesorhizobium sp. YIM 152430]
MGEIVNLRLLRKRRKRDDDAATAEANRRKHGRTLVERKAQEAAEKARAAHLDAHRLTSEADE